MSTTDEDMSSVPAGWYRDLEVPGQQRYWDGSSWTEHVAPIPGSSHTAPVPPSPLAPRVAPEPGATTPKRPNGLGLAALIVGAVAVVLAAIPFVSFGAWVPALVAIGLGIAGLVAKSRKRLLAGLGLGLGALALMVSIGVSIAATSALVTSVDQALDQASPDVEPAATPSASDEDDEEQTPAPAKGTGEAFDDPALAGTVVEVTSFTGGDYTLSIGEPTWNANDMVANENPFNDPPAEGMQYLLVPFTLTNIDDSGESVDPSYESYQVSFLLDGKTYQPATAVIPDDIDGKGEIFPGGTVTGNQVYLVPAGAQDGIWVIDGEFFVDAA